MFKKIGTILCLFSAAMLCMSSGFAQDSGAAKLKIMDAAGDLGLSEFAAAIDGSGLADTLDNQGVLVIGPGSFVIFAPSDAAFAEATDIDMNAVKENATELKRILAYHIVWNDGRFENISELSSAKTMQGENLTINSTDGLKVNGANVTGSQSYANGTIYVIDRVLLPKTASRLGVIEAANDLGAKKFAAAIKSAGLADTLNGQGLMGMESLSEGPFTIFAPSDSAFDAAKATIDAINKKDAGMRNLLSYHIVDSESLINASESNSAKTMLGDSLAIDANLGLAGSASVLQSERYANGIVYVIDQVLVPIRLAM
ncbi:MAG: Fasciclin domain protein [Methanosaeta sp. PtaU1.Bin112]|nr:MAG: Fasciclin domain protein [Methanosaeta sp. PtaU1.Bin112]